MVQHIIDTVFKITTENDWKNAAKSGEYAGSRDDVRDGFIHLSTAAQARETAARHFAGRDGLVLIAFASAQLDTALRWEPSRGGALFPHHYAPLPIKAALWVKPLPRDTHGQHIFPPEFK